MRRILVSLFSLLAFSFAQFQELSTCLEEQLHGRKYKKVRDPLFSVVYGNAAVEVLNAYSTLEMKELEAFAYCYRLQESLEIEGGNFKHEIPFSLIASYFPSFSTSLTNVLEEGFKKARWDKEILKNLRISNFSFVSSEGMSMDPYLEELKVKQKQLQQQKSVFVIGPLAEITADTTHAEAMSRDDKLRDLITSDYSDAYEIILLLSDRTKFSGGEIVIDYKPLSPNQSSPSSSKDTDEYDDELVTNVVPNYHKPEVDKLTVEKGSILIIHPFFRYGITPVQHGKRNALTIRLKSNSNS